MQANLIFFELARLVQGKMSLIPQHSQNFSEILALLSDRDGSGVIYFNSYLFILTLKTITENYSVAINDLVFKHRLHCH
jgi:hypothetical protein